MADGIDFGNALDWVNPGNSAAVEEDIEATPTEPKEAVVDSLEEKSAQQAVEPEAKQEPVDDSPAIPAFVEDLGGEDGARQLIPLAQAIRDAEGSPEQIGTALYDALKKVFTPDQLGALTWKQYENFGELFAEQFLEEHPEFVEKRGYVKAEQDDYIAEPDDGEDLSPREKQLQQRLADLEGKYTQLQQKDSTSAQQSEQAQQQQIQIAAEQAMFGTVVDKAFEKLEGWTDAETKEAVQIALAMFGRDQEAVKHYQGGLRYQATQQPILKVEQAKASQKFAVHLGKAIKVIGADKTPVQPQATVPPAKKEFGSTTRQGSVSGDPPAVSPKKESFFDPNTLMEAVNKRLATGAAN